MKLCKLGLMLNISFLLRICIAGVRDTLSRERFLALTGTCPGPLPGAWILLQAVTFPARTSMCLCVLPALTAPGAVLCPLPEREAHHLLWLRGQVIELNCLCPNPYSATWMANLGQTT